MMLAIMHAVVARCTEPQEPRGRFLTSGKFAREIDLSRKGDIVAGKQNS